MPDPTNPMSTTDETRAAAPPGAGAINAGWSRLDQLGRLVFAGGIALALIALAGNLLGTWSLTGLGLVMLVAGVTLAVVAWLAAAGVRPWPIAPGFLEVGAGAAAAYLALLNLLELAADLDDLDDWGGPLGGLLSIVLAVVAVAVLVAAARRAAVTSLAGWTAPQSVRLATVGGVLVFVGVGLGLLIGARAIGQTTALTLAFTVLALVAVRAAAERGALRLPIPGAWLAVGLAIIAIVFVLDLLFTFFRVGFDPADWLFFAIHLAGLALVTYGALVAAGFSASMLRGSTPPASPPPAPPA